MAGTFQRRARRRAMYEWITITAYPWIKALHVIAVISWMAGMLYLPRLFVYHCDAEIGSKQSETFKVMERRLLKAIINPAMIVTWLAGLYLAWSGHWYTSGWFHAKLTLVIILSGVHGFFSRWVKDFAADQNTRSPKFYRVINEVPTLIVIGIVVLVIVKPF
jgi:protoporphyrinogen IX oxidase